MLIDQVKFNQNLNIIYLSYSYFSVGNIYVVNHLNCFYNRKDILARPHYDTEAQADIIIIIFVQHIWIRRYKQHKQI